MVTIVIYQDQQQKMATYNCSQMETADKLDMLQQLLQAAELEEGMHELISARIRHVQEYSHYYTQMGLGLAQEQLIESSMAAQSKVPTRSIYMNEIGPEDAAWTGIHFSADHGRPRFQTFYRCSCNTCNTIYIFEKTKKIYCQGCKKRLPVRPATAHGHFRRGDELQTYRDELGNYYISQLD